MGGVIGGGLYANCALCSAAVNDKNVATYAWFIITWVFATVVGQVVGMVYATDAINGALLGRLVGNTIGAAIVLWHCRRWLTWRLDTTYLAKPLRFAAFLLLAFY